MDRKGQYLIASLIATFFTLIAFVVLYPILRGYIDDVVAGCVKAWNETLGNYQTTCTTPMDVYTATILQLAPFFIVIAILLTIVFASLPVRE